MATEQLDDQYLLANGAMKNVKILADNDKLVTGPDAAKEDKLHLKTVPRLNKKGNVFSSPFRGVDCQHIIEVQVFKLKSNEGQGNHRTLFLKRFG